MDDLLHAYLSDLGRQRPANEDRCLADPARGLFLVADGMADGVSPQLVVDWLPGMLTETLADDAPLDGPHTASLVRDVLARLSDRVRDEAARRDDMLGTTLALVLIRRGTALIAHLGDSRVYLCREGRLQALTRDHSRVQELIDCGELPEETPELRRWNGGPTQFVGMTRQSDADVRTVPLLAGDRLLLCSDGLTGELPDEAIRLVLDERWEPERMCRELVGRANASGGHDNVTVLVIVAGPAKETGA